MLIRAIAVFVLSAGAFACAERSGDDARNSSAVAPTSIMAPAANGASPSASGLNALAATPAETSTDTQRFDTTGGFLNLCNGDTVDVAGTFHVTFHTTVSGNNVLFSLHQTGRVTGTSQTTGTQYIWNSSFQVTDRAPLVNGAASATLVSHDRFIALGSATSFKAKLLIHVTINANGDVTTSYEFMSESCVG